MPRPIALIALLAIAAAAPALAQNHPQLMPTRDVTIDYLATGGANQPRTLRIYMEANDAKIRVEGAGMPGAMIIDRIGKQATMLLAPQHAYLEMPMDPARAQMFVLRDTGDYTRGGTDKVAGIPCTIWSSKTNGNTGCLTADGVLLRGESITPQGQRVTLVATAVTYGKLPDSTFQPPSDFKKMQLPAGMPPNALSPGAQSPGTMPPGGGRPPG